jgi:hypothetical protein
VSEFASTERGLITNARCLTEGVDVPDIDCVMFADPRRSAVDIVQAVGRALRPAKGKKMGYVIVPILHDAKAKPDDIFASEEFQEILTTLRALAANDERIIEYFRSVSQGKQRSGGGSVVFDIDEKLAKRIDLEEFAREIDLKCWDRLAKLSWRPFEEAREFVRALQLNIQSEWFSFCRGLLPEKGSLPADIPATPSEIYKNRGWNGYGDWLGTGRIADHQKQFLPFVNARDFVRSLNLKSKTEWELFCKGQLPEKGTLPPDIPAIPRQTYLNQGWIGYGDWLGTGRIANFNKVYRPFKKARSFVQALQLKNVNEWFRYCKGELPDKGTLPADIPTAAHSTYATQGWKGYGDWLGTGTIANFNKVYRRFEEARAFAQSLKLNSQNEWVKFCKSKLPEIGTLPVDIPANPYQTYRSKGWEGFGNWLGTGRIASQKMVYRTFEEARAFVQSLNLKNENEWRSFSKGQLLEKGTLPADIPASPHTTYANKGWQGFGDWLGTGTIAPRLRKFLPFEEARAFVHSLQLKSQKEWRKFSKGELPNKGMLPANIPATPNEAYATAGWKGMGDWLGTGTIAPRLRKFLPFEEARRCVHTLKLKNVAEWQKFCRGQLIEKGILPPDIPAAPQSAYASKGWAGFGDWLGKS